MVTKKLKLQQNKKINLNRDTTKKINQIMLKLKKMDSDNTKIVTKLNL